MHQRRAAVLAVLMLTSSIVLLLNNEDNDAFSEINDNLYTPLDAIPPSFPSPGNPWIEDSLNQRVESGVEKIEITYKGPKQGKSMKVRDEITIEASNRDKAITILQDFNLKSY